MICQTWNVLQNHLRVNERLLNQRLCSVRILPGFLVGCSEAHISMVCSSRAITGLGIPGLSGSLLWIQSLQTLGTLSAFRLTAVELESPPLTKVQILALEQRPWKLKPGL